MERVIIRSARVEEWDDAMELAFRVFLKYEAPDYGKAGTDAFARFITDEMLKKLFIAIMILLLSSMRESTIH